MRKRIFIVTVMVSTFANAWSQTESTNQLDKHNAPTMTNKEKAVAVLKVLETGNAEAIKYVNPTKYIQHNLMAPNGIDAMEGFLKMATPGSIKVGIKRVFQDGDYVFTHSDYNLFGSKIGFDIFRFEDGLIVEHWDNLQETPTKLNPGGHSMIDGGTELRDFDKTMANKELIKLFFKEIVEGGKGEKITEFISEDVVQHTPLLPDKLSEALKIVGDLDYFKNMGNHKLKMILGEGNFVLAGVECTFYGKPAVYYDLFRIENDKIVERWDTMEETLPKEKWQNSNGKF